MSKNQEELLNQAIILAQSAHIGQVDKAGNAYIGHPLRVMNNVKTLEEKIVAVLHDAVEDSDLTLENLLESGFPEHIVAAIDAITKRTGEDYEIYLSRVIVNPIALRVKIADMTDNLDKSRISQPTSKDYQRWEKYEAVLPRLLKAVHESIC